MCWLGLVVDFVVVCGSFVMSFIGCWGNFVGCFWLDVVLVLLVVSFVWVWVARGVDVVLRHVVVVVDVVDIARQDGLEPVACY